MSKLCTICGTEIPDGEEFEFDGQAYCHEHFEELFTTCDECGAIYRRDSLTHTGNGRDVCENCLDNEYFLCEDCEEYYPNDSTCYVNPDCYDQRMVCESCYEDYDMCSDCGERYTDRHIWAHDDYRTICDGCSDYWYICADCGDIVHTDDVYWSDNDEPYCGSCYENNRRNSRAIHDYGYKPCPVFGTTGPDDGTGSYNGAELTFGVELECDKGRSPGDAAAEISSLTDRVYCKHDGSLDNGYEVVTMPGTLAWHMNVFPWGEICRISVNRNFKSHDAGTCGLHIHIGRNQLGSNATEITRTTARMIALSYVLWPEIGRFSRRNGDMHWCHRNEGPDRLRPGLSEARALDEIFRASYQQGRYTAVNVQNNATVELRFNRGTLKVSTIYACLQLASNLALFAKDHTLEECINATWDDVVHYHEYEELTTYVKSRFDGFVPTGRPSISWSKEASDASTTPATLLASLDPDYGAEWEPADYRLQRGDLVVMTVTGESGGYPVAGSIGVVLESTDGVGSVGVIWHEDNPNHSRHNTCDNRYPRRQWYVPAANVRAIHCFANGAPVDRGTMLYLAKNNIIVGDRVASNQGPVAGVGILFGAVGGTTGAENGYFDSAYVQWDGFEGGHNSSFPFATRGFWNVAPSSLTNAI